MRVLITGASGFMGRHLSRVLLGLRNTEVFGMRHRGSAGKCVSGVREFCGDILDAPFVRRLIRRIRPHRIYHLAGQASVVFSWKDPRGTFLLNVEGTRNLLEAVLAEKIVPRIHIAGSSEVYGVSGSAGCLLTENAPLKPVNPYAVSKIAQEYLAIQYFLSRGLPVVCTRAFNHFGPGQSERFAASSFARQFALIARGLKRPRIEVGNLRTVRDFTDVRDTALAYYLALEKGKPGEVYNVCGGRPREVGEILRFYLRGASVKIKVFPKAGRSRTAEARYLAGDSRKLRERTGWRPRIGFEETLNDLLQDWMERTRREKK